MIILQISPVNTKKKRNGAIRSGSLRTPASRVSLKQEKCVRQIKVCSSTVFECGFSWITARLTVKVRMESNLPVSPNANPPPRRPDCAVCLSLCVTSSITYTPPPCSLLLHVCLHPPVSTPPGRHGNTCGATMRSEQGPPAATGFFFFFVFFLRPLLEKKKKLLWKIFWSRVQQWERNMRLMWRASGRFMLLQVFKAGWQ